MVFANDWVTDGSPKSSLSLGRGYGGLMYSLASTSALSDGKECESSRCDRTRLKRARREAPAVIDTMAGIRYQKRYQKTRYPEDPTPSGSCNFSRIDHVDLALQLQEGLGKEQVSIVIFARNWNVLRFREGLAGLAYAN